MKKVVAQVQLSVFRQVEVFVADDFGDSAINAEIALQVKNEWGDCDELEILEKRVEQV